MGGSCRMAWNGGWNFGRDASSDECFFGTQGEDVLAYIGPSISCTSFEVGQEIYDAFSGKGIRWNVFLSLMSRRVSITWTWEANRMALIDFGVPDVQVQLAGICTFARHESSSLLGV
ncbi:MAG: laccase domain-containing protein [Bacteroides graminisolvens]